MKWNPDSHGYWGKFGGKFVPETVMGAIEELESEYEQIKKDDVFQQELSKLLKYYAGRPTPLYFAEQFTQRLGRAKIYLKREDLAHTGAHKVNNTLGQVLLAKKMGKTRIIAETGAGQHGVATATICALLNIPCVVYMGAEDVHRQQMNVFRMELLGAEVRPVESGTKTLKDATNEALRDWVTNVRDTYYCIGSVVGPHPYPMMVRDFQAVIGEETRKQIMQLEGRLPDYLIACVGGGSNAMGIFYPFLNDKSVQMIGVEAGGRGKGDGDHGAPLNYGTPGALHGAMSYLLQDKHGQIQSTHSVSAGLDYPGVGPEHSYLKDEGRIDYVTASDDEALNAFKFLCQSEGIIPALESSHAVAHAIALALKLKSDDIIIVNLSGRGDKDLDIVKGRV